MNDILGLGSVLPATEDIKKTASSESLKKLFGKDTGITTPTPVDLMRGYHALIVHTDIVEQSIVGDCYANLLRHVEVPVGGKFGELCVVRYPRPQYIPLRKTDF
jgi:hypothetical protein